MSAKSSSIDADADRLEHRRAVGVGGGRVAAHRSMLVRPAAAAAGFLSRTDFRFVALLPAASVNLAASFALTLALDAIAAAIDLVAAVRFGFRVTFLSLPAATYLVTRLSLNDLALLPAPATVTFPESLIVTASAAPAFTAILTLPPFCL